MGAHSVYIKSTGHGPYQNEIVTGQHKLWADEPEDMGGRDSGPSPYEFLMAALGTCKSMTMRMYADRKNWPLEGVEIEVSHEKVAAPENARAHNDKIDKFTCNLLIKGEGLDEEQRARLLEIADRCPVHRTLTHDVLIETSLEKERP